MSWKISCPEKDQSHDSESHSITKVYYNVRLLQFAKA